MEFVDYYKIMGLEDTATADEIKRVYRKLARKYHPDVSKEEDSESRFKEVGEAYQVLKDTDKRAEYDELRRYQSQSDGPFRAPPGWDTQSGGYADNHGGDPVDFTEFFEQIFGARAAAQSGAGSSFHHDVRGQDMHTAMSISLRDAFNGSKLSLSLSVPVRQESGAVASEHKSLQVKIPAGVVNDQKIRLRGQGAPGMGEAPAGDLYIQLQVQDDDVFHLDGKDISVSVPLMPWEAAMGASIEVPTLGGTVNVTVPPNSQVGKILRLKGRGMPGEPAGDQYVSLSVVVPEAVTDEQKKLYQSMSSLWSDNPRKTSGQAK
jgi:curved DNA-binding protein